MNNEYLYFFAIGLHNYVLGIGSGLSRDCLGIVSGLSRERFGSLSQNFRFLSPTSPSHSRGNLEEISNHSRTNIGVVKSKDK